MAVLTVEFEVGVQRQPALVRLYNQVFSNQDWLPPGVGVGQPLVKPKGIDDVPVMAAHAVERRSGARRAPIWREVAHTLETELKRVPGTRDVYTIGAPDRAVLVTLDAASAGRLRADPGDLRRRCAPPTWCTRPASACGRVPCR
jgi:multidrug efflux pump subunit AcrB